MIEFILGLLILGLLFFGFLLDHKFIAILLCFGWIASWFGESKFGQFLRTLFWILVTAGAAYKGFLNVLDEHWILLIFDIVIAVISINRIKSYMDEWKRDKEEKRKSKDMLFSKKKRNTHSGKTDNRYPLKEHTEFAQKLTDELNRYNHIFRDAPVVFVLCHPDADKNPAFVGGPPQRRDSYGWDLNSYAIRVFREDTPEEIRNNPYHPDYKKYSVEAISSLDMIGILYGGYQALVGPNFNCKPEDAVRVFASGRYSKCISESVNHGLITRKESRGRYPHRSNGEKNYLREIESDRYSWYKDETDNRDHLYVPDFEKAAAKTDELYSIYSM